MSISPRSRMCTASAADGLRCWSTWTTRADVAHDRRHAGDRCRAARRALREARSARRVRSRSRVVVRSRSWPAVAVDSEFGRISPRHLLMAVELYEHPCGGQTRGRKSLQAETIGAYLTIGHLSNKVRIVQLPEPCAAVNSAGFLSGNESPARSASFSCSSCSSRSDLRWRR